MNKKPYTPPLVTKIKLEIKQSVLSTCNTSIDITPQVDEELCSPTTYCQFNS